MTKRDPGLDILRCVAILLVMFRHYYVTGWLTRGGWIGVDLFFVLSGFLVSGLLFREFTKRGKVNGTRFLIRRGFKIYPAFWFVLGLHLLYFQYKGIGFTKAQLAAELLFVQNFFPGIMGISWTLAVEEHFYLLLTAVAVLAARKGWISQKKPVLIFCLSVLAACLAGRTLAIFFIHPFSNWTHFFPTWFRIDELIFGVLIAWFAHFEPLKYRTFVTRNKFVLIAFLAVILPLPFLLEYSNPFLFTVGFTLIYLAMGGLVALFSVMKWNAGFGVRFLAMIGRYSYCIYLVHLVVGLAAANFVRVHFIGNAPELFYALVAFSGNIASGIIVSLLVEQFFLRIRDVYFPRTA